MPKTDRTGMNVSWPGLGRDDPPYRLGKEGAWEDAERKHGDVRKQTGQMPGSGKSRFRKMRRQAAVPSAWGNQTLKMPVRMDRNKRSRGKEQRSREGFPGFFPVKRKKPPGQALPPGRQRGGGGKSSPAGSRWHVPVKGFSLP